MDQKDIDKLLELRGAWDKFKASKQDSAALKDFYTVAWAYGMETQHHIEAFNESMLIKLLQEYRTAHNNCDLCVGFKDIPPCFEDFSTASCVTTARREIGVDAMYKDLLMMYRLGYSAGLKTLDDLLDGTKDQVIGLPFKDKTRFIRVIDNKLTRCPKAQNYYECKIPDSEFPFTLDWKL